MKEHWTQWGACYVAIGLLFILASVYFLRDYERPCASGHYERKWITNYMYVNKIMIPAGGYYADVFVCDTRTTRK